MRAALLVVPLLLAGCMTSQGEGRLVVQMSDEPNDIGDFSGLLVTLDRIVLSRAASEDPNATEEGEDLDIPAANRTLDLTDLVGANATTVFDGEVASGDYERMDIFVSEAVGTLRDGGDEVVVKVPSGRLFLNQDFTIGEGEETVFVFDVTVHRLGHGDYQLKPNAGESGPKGR